MTIQPSVLIWTVINFCVFMWLMNRLLFKPLLRFMDAREEKLAGVRRRRENAQHARAEAQQLAEETRLAAEKKARGDAEAALAEARQAATQMLAQKEKEYAALLERQRLEIAAQRREVQQRLDAGMDDVVSAFVQELTL